MTYAIHKVSWNPVQGQKAEGGICGSAFFIDQQTAPTAHHVLSSAIFRTPNPGFSHCRYWLLGRDGSIVDCNGAALVDLPEVDATVIKFGAVIPSVKALSLSAEPISPAVAVSNQGYSEGHGSVQLRWAGSDVALDAFDLSPFFSDGDGAVASCSVTNISTSDVNLIGIKVLKLSYGGLRGMSGGPLLVKGTPRAVGLMSFGLPPNVPQKQELFAVAAEEIIKRL